MAVKAEAHRGLFLQALASAAGKEATKHESSVKAGKQYEIAATVRGRVVRGNQQWDLEYVVSADLSVAPPKNKSTSPGAAEVLAIALAAVGPTTRKKIRDALASRAELSKEQLDEAKRLIAQQKVVAPGTKCVVRCDAQIEAAA